MARGRVGPSDRFRRILLSEIREPLVSCDRNALALGLDRHSRVDGGCDRARIHAWSYRESLRALDGLSISLSDCQSDVPSEFLSGLPDDLVRHLLLAESVGLFRHFLDSCWYQRIPFSLFLESVLARVDRLEALNLQAQHRHWRKMAKQSHRSAEISLWGLPGDRAMVRLDDPTCCWRDVLIW